jgi:hypothetical protein
MSGRLISLRSAAPVAPATKAAAADLRIFVTEMFDRHEGPAVLDALLSIYVNVALVACGLNETERALSRLVCDLPEIESAISKARGQHQ